METILQWISQYGYAGLFACLMFGIAGLPIPDETILVFAGYLIAAKRLDPASAFLSATTGAVCGISLSYWLGRSIGYAVVERYGRVLHVTTGDLQRVQLWFERFGNWLLSFGYFIPGVRHFTALVAGASRLRFRSFALYAYGGAVLWVGTFMSLGYVFGDNWRTLVDILHRYSLPILIVIICLFIPGWFWWKRRRA